MAGIEKAIHPFLRLGRGPGPKVDVSQENSH